MIGLKGRVDYIFGSKVDVVLNVWRIKVGQ